MNPYFPLTPGGAFVDIKFLTLVTVSPVSVVTSTANNIYFKRTVSNALDELVSAVALIGPTLHHNHSFPTYKVLITWLASALLCIGGCLQIQGPKSPARLRVLRVPGDNAALHLSPAVHYPAQAMAQRGRLVAGPACALADLRHRGAHGQSHRPILRDR
jgi:hypothetical protein